MYMTTDADVAKRVIQDELEFQINTAKAKLEVLANRAEGTTVQAEVEAYKTLSPKVQAIQQKFRELKKARVHFGCCRSPGTVRGERRHSQALR
jgi:hypothetical protein